MGIFIVTGSGGPNISTTYENQAGSGGPNISTTHKNQAITRCPNISTTHENQVITNKTSVLFLWETKDDNISSYTPKMLS